MSYGSQSCDDLVINCTYCYYLAKWNHMSAIYWISICGEFLYVQSSGANNNRCAYYISKINPILSYSIDLSKETWKARNSEKQFSSSHYLIICLPKKLPLWTNDNFIYACHAKVDLPNVWCIIWRYIYMYWQTQSRQSKSKSKADDLVFIKIEMSNPPPPPPPPPHRESFKESR